MTQYLMISLLCLFGAIQLIILDSKFDEAQNTFMTEGILSWRNQQMMLKSLSQLITCYFGLFRAFAEQQYSKIEDRGMGYFGRMFANVKIIKIQTQPQAIIIGRIQMEDNTQAPIQSNLSKTSSYLLGLAEVKGNALQQEMLMHLNSKYTLNEIKKLVKNGDYIIDTLNSIFKDLQLNRIYAVIKRISKSFSNICNHLIYTIQKSRLSQPTPNSIPLPQIACKQEKIDGDEMLEQEKAKMKLKRMRGICLYNQNYKRNIDSEGRNQDIQNSKKKKLEQEQQQVDEKQFKRRLFNKLKKQLKEVQQELYCPSPDEMTTFIIFEKKFIESFNHLSQAESLEIITQYLQNSKISAIQVLNQQEDMSENIAKFKIEIDLLIKDAKNITNTRNQTISDKFQIILSKFLKKRQELFKATKNKLNVYQKMIEERDGKKVSVGVETNVKQLGTLKGFERKVNELEQKYKTKDEEKNKAYRAMLQKSDSELSALHKEITKYKIANKTLTDDILQSKKQHSKILEKLYEKRNQQKQQRNQDSIQKSIDKKSQLKIEMMEVDDRNMGRIAKEKDKKLAFRQSIMKTTNKQQGDEEQTAPQVRVKPLKSVSIKQIKNGYKTQTAIQEGESQDFSQKSIERNQNSNTKVFEKVQKLSVPSNQKHRKKEFKSSYVLKQEQNQEVKSYKATTLQVIRTEKNDKSLKLLQSKQSEKQVKSYLKIKTEQKIQNLKKSFHSQTGQKRIVSSYDTRVQQKLDDNNFSFHEINRTVGQPEASNHLISEDRIKDRPIHKLEKAVASHSNSMNSTKKGNRNKAEHQAPKYRDRFMGKKNGQRNIRFTRTQVYSVVCCNGNVTQFQEKQQKTVHQEPENIDSSYVVTNNRKQRFKQLVPTELQRQSNITKELEYLSKQKRHLKLYKNQSNSLYLPNEEKQKHYQLNNSDSVFKVRSLLKQNMGNFEKNEKQKQNLVFKKKLLKHLQSMEWLNKRKYQGPFKLNYQSLHENSIFNEKIKLKENEKLKKIKKKRQQFQNLYRKKKSNYEGFNLNQSKLPGINARAIF